jgi:hypothetical protein
MTRTQAEPFIQAEIAKLEQDCLLELADAAEDYAKCPIAEVFHVLNARLKAAREILAKP